MARFRRLSVALTATALAATSVLTACGSSDEKASDAGLRIGAILPLTGPGAAIGELMKNGTELAAKHINDNGGIAGKKLKVVYEDSAAVTTKAVTAMKRLASEKDIEYVLVSSSDNIMAVTPIAEQDRMALMNGGGQNDELGGLSKFLYNNIPLQGTELSAMAGFAANNLGKTSVVLSANDAYGNGGKQVWTAAFEAAGGKVVASASYALGSTDYRAQLSQLKQHGADTIYFTAFGRDAQLVLKQIRELGLKATPVGTTVTVSGDTKGIPEAVGMYHTSLRFEPTGDFTSDYKATYGSEPDLYAANYYNGVTIFADAYEHALKTADKVDGEALAEAIKAIGTFDTVNGKLAFNEKNSALSPFDVAVVESGGVDKVVARIEIDDLK